MSSRRVMLLLALVIGADRATKLIVASRMQPGESIVVVPGFVSLSYVRNPGAAFGLLAGPGMPWRGLFLIVVSAVTVLVLTRFLIRLRPELYWQRAATAGVIAGAVGNLYDRLRYGEVIDFLDLHAGAWHWPAFNIADSFITVGVLVLLGASLQWPKERCPGASKKEAGP